MRRNQAVKRVIIGDILVEWRREDKEIMAMFESLSKRLEGVFTNLSGKGKLTEADVDEAMREVRLALLGADVRLQLVRQIVERVKAKAVGTDILGSFSPAQQVLQIANEELGESLGASR